MKRAAALVVGVIAGAAVLAAVSDSIALKAVALTAFGVACVVAVSLVFLAVGRGEDEERAAAAAPPEAPEPPAPHDPHEGEAARRARSRPPRRPT